MIWRLLVAWADGTMAVWLRWAGAAALCSYGMGYPLDVACRAGAIVGTIAAVGLTGVGVLTSKGAKDA